tara:strand:- start:24748 stop:24984 length:237 start_codon:yes stop_codon:yes gene_type:complete
VAKGTLQMTVLRSINNPDGSLCVDVFSRDDGSIGFEEFRRDVEDTSGWFAIGGYAERRFTTVEDALRAATQAVVWFEG